MDVYPIFLIGLGAKRCVVVGGGPEAERKVEGLLDSSAMVTVISAELSDRLHGWADAGTIAWVPRAYQPGDLQDAFLVIATTDEPQTNTDIWHEAQTVGALLNVVDDPARSTFIAGSVVRQGPLTLAISTSGCAPTLAVQLRQQLAREFGPEYAAFLDLMRELRAPLAARYPDVQQRRALWAMLLESDLLELLRAGQPDLARQLVDVLLGDKVLTETEAVTP